MSRARAGFSSLEFVALLPLYVSGMLLLLVALFYWLAHAQLQIETYTLARARLYGNTQRCAASRWWPSDWAPLEMRCRGTRVQARFQLRLRERELAIMSAETDLR